MGSPNGAFSSSARGNTRQQARSDPRRVTWAPRHRLLGLTVHGFWGYPPGDAVPTVVQLLDGVAPANSARVRPDTTPGAIWRYSGGGSTVAQLLMQDVTGVAFPELVRELVLEPAGMVRSGYEQPLPSSRTASAAVGHRQTGRP
jgi:CubicO group peptidase (beta-lactamase class C family)